MKITYKRPKIHIDLINLLVDGTKQIGFKYEQNEHITNMLKRKTELKWSTDHNVYYIKRTKHNLNWIFETFRGIAWINGNQLFDYKKNGKSLTPTSMKQWRERPKEEGKRYCPKSFFDKLERKKYSYNTAKTYITLFEKFLNDHPGIPIMDIDEHDINEYLNFLVSDGRSSSYLNQMINAIKFYYEVVEGMPNRFYQIDRPRKKNKLPKVLSLAEVRDILRLTKNIKHRCILSLLYSAGLRRSELLNLKPEDIDSNRMIIYVRDGKRGKDRQTILDKGVLEDLRIYFKAYRPEKWLFESPSGDQYSGTSVSAILTAASRRAGIQKNVTPHMLRHSFATHLLESGVNLRYIQELLGHSSSITTEVYTQVANNMIRTIESPINFLNLDED